MTSTDGFCSVCVFDASDLGEVMLHPPFPKALKREEMAQKIDFPAPSPPNRVPSPARSNSATSNTSGFHMGNLSMPSPIIAQGSNSLSTPPQTPVASIATESVSSVSSVTGTAVTIPGLTTTKRSSEEQMTKTTSEPKKRRIQPTLISGAAQLPTPADTTNSNRDSESETS